MTLPSLIINKNNLAVTALTRGCYRDAMCLIQETTMNLNELYRRNAVEEINRGREGNEPKAAFPVQSFPVGPMYHGGTRTMLHDQDDSSVYRRAIVLSNQEDNLPVVASVVLFNLALCHHVIGTSINSPRRIASALKFYKMAYQIIEENKRVCVFGDLLVLAIINNIAEASAQIYDVKRSNKWFTFLSRILGVAEAERRVLPALEEEDYVFFYINAMVHEGQMLNAAPAA